MAKNESNPSPISITLIKTSEWKNWLKKQKTDVIEWIKLNHFAAEPGSICAVPALAGKQSCMLAGIPEILDIWSIAGLPDKLPAGTYILENKLDSKANNMLALGWLLGSYQFTRYKKHEKDIPILNGISKEAQKFADILNYSRDLINTPANDMGPAELAGACKQIAKQYKAQYREIIGEELIKQNYPAIYEVGKASSRQPRLVDIHWGNLKHAKVTLVGKGVCFDSGGLDIKPSSGMKLMKKDMGGAAAVLALAQMIMFAQLPVRLRVLIPSVENSISGNAYRPFDIIKTRKGITVEVGNTDAEGRLILGDALFEADSEKPDLLIDCATLTGAARTALGTDIPALFTSDDKLANDIARHSIKEGDPLWRLPLWPGYRDMLKSSAADINSAPDSGYAGAITAALYLKEFVQNTTNWAHIDMMAWNLSKRPGRPQGAEVMAIRCLFSMIKERFENVQQKAGFKKK
jgi:leucyl aminopeptidase